MTVIRCFVFLVVLTFLWTPSSGDTEVSCVYMERCILPCSFQVGPDVVIHWTKAKTAGSVYSYYDDQDQLDYQHQIFRNRTSLFKDQISRGNASLQLTEVKVQDEGRYECYISTTIENNRLFINLKVDAPIRKVNIQQVENRITCRSEGIYPQPELTWSTTPPSNINLHNTTTVQQNEQQLYSISSSLILSHSHTDLVYSCTVKTRRNKRTAALRNQNGSVGGIAAGVVVSILVLAILVGFCIYIRRSACRRENNNNVPMMPRGNERRQDDDAAPDPAAPLN